MNPKDLIWYCPSCEKRGSVNYKKEEKKNLRLLADYIEKAHDEISPVCSRNFSVRILNNKMPKKERAKVMQMAVA